MKEKHGIYLAKVFYPCPRNFSECDQATLLQILEIMAEQQPHTDMVVKILPLIFKAKQNFELLHFFAVQLDGIDLYDMAVFAEAFILAEPSPIKLLPSVLIDGNSFVGPADYLDNLRFEEFIYADAHFMRFIKTSDEQALSELCAVLYRPMRESYKPDAPDVSDDCREDFNHNLVTKRAELFANLSKGQRLAILHFYMGCREAIVKQYPDIFKATEEESTGKGDGWVGVWLSISGNKFGDAEKTAKTNLHWILKELNIMMRTYHQNKSKA